jgi:hypothetical protein
MSRAALLFSGHLYRPSRMVLPEKDATAWNSSEPFQKGENE